jgi:hypothetical protein
MKIRVRMIGFISCAMTRAIVNSDLAAKTSAARDLPVQIDTLQFIMKLVRHPKKVMGWAVSVGRDVEACSSSKRGR